VPDAAVDDLLRLLRVLHAELSLIPGLVRKRHVVLVNCVGRAARRHPPCSGAVLAVLPHLKGTCISAPALGLVTPASRHLDGMAQRLITPVLILDPPADSSNPFPARFPHEEFYQVNPAWASRRSPSLRLVRVLWLGDGRGAFGSGASLRAGDGEPQAISGAGVVLPVPCAARRDGGGAARGSAVAGWTRSPAQCASHGSFDLARLWWTIREVSLCLLPGPL
jgi:hypothetical protein